jgi:uncharacterized protein YbcI
MAWEPQADSKPKSSDDDSRGNPAEPGGPLTGKPTWLSTSAYLATSASFFAGYCKDGGSRQGRIPLDKSKSSMAQQIARAAVAFVCQRTGQVPGSVDVAQSDETLVITLRNTLAPAVRAQSRHPETASKLHEVYRELFAESSGWLRREISRITELQVLAVTAAVEAATGAVVVVLTTGRVPGAFGQRKELAAGGSAEGLPGVGASATPDRQVHPTQEPIPVERPLPKSAEGPFARSCGSDRRASATFALWALSSFRLAPHSVADTSAKRGGQT